MLLRAVAVEIVTFYPWVERKSCTYFPEGAIPPYTFSSLDAFAFTGPFLSPHPFHLRAFHFVASVGMDCSSGSASFSLSS